VNDSFNPDGKPGAPARNGKPGARRRKAAPDAAFEIWLERGLHAMYDSVAEEPIPPELLALIEKDRKQGG